MILEVRKERQSSLQTSEPNQLRVGISSDLEEAKTKTFRHMPNNIRLRMYLLGAFITSHQGKLQLPAEGFSFPGAGRVQTFS